MRLPRPGRPALLAALVTLALAGSIGGVGTYALWSDSATIPAVTISAGNLDLIVRNEAGAEVTGTWNDLAMASIAPGESTAAALMLENAGTVGFLIDVDAKAGNTDGLLTATTAEVFWNGTSTVDSSYKREEACSGTSIFGPAALTGADQRVVNSTAGGYSTLIAAGSQKTVCVKITLLASAANSAQTQSLTPILSITATQQ